MATQEKEFLAAYRAHMFTVQKDLHALRAKLEISETSAQKSEKLQKMEEERNW